MAPTKTGSRAILVLMLVTFAAVFGCSLRRQLNAQALNPRPNFEIVPGDYGLTPEALWVPTDGADPDRRRKSRRVDSISSPAVKKV